MSKIDSINAADYFKDPSTELSETLDFNKDGTVDIADYRYAKLILSNNDPDDDSLITVTEDQLDKAFSALIRADEENNENKTTEINHDNALVMSETIVKEINKSTNNPQNATSLNNLQEIGKTLTRKIAECTAIAEALGEIIDLNTDTLKRFEEEKDEEVYEYDLIQEEIDDKTAEIDENIQKILNMTEKLSAAREEECSKIVAQSIQDYISGKENNKPLVNVIQDNLAKTVSGANFYTADMDYLVRRNQSIGKTINTLCSDVETISAKIKKAMQNYNYLNDYVNACAKNRNKTISAAQTASDLYKTGYQKRIDMRADIVEKYHVAATDGADEIGWGNEQVKNLAKFLNARELNNMPFSDAWYILSNTFDQCGIKYDDETRSISIPNSSDTTAQNVYNALASSLLSNYGVVATRYDKDNPTTGTNTDGVFIVTSYSTSSYTGKALTVGDNILDFCSDTKSRGDQLSGSKDHNDDKSNDAVWMEFYNKLSDEYKNLSLTSGQAYIFSKDGELLGTAANSQIADVNYSKNSKRYASDESVNNNFQVKSDLGITAAKKHSGEEGSGGTITLNGVTYNVAQTIYRKATPLVLDLNGDGIKTTNITNGVNFDLNADGTMDRTAWTTKQDAFDDAFLVLDKNGDGQINNGAELFGNQNGAENGFEELAKYDSNGDGKIDKNDEAYSQMQLWCDKNADGKVDEGELKGLEEMGVAELNLEYNTQYDAAGNLLEDENGNTIGMQGSFTRTDGTSNQMTDVLFRNMDLNVFETEDTSTLNSRTEYFVLENETIEFSENKLSKYNPFMILDNKEIDTADIKDKVQDKINGMQNNIENAEKYDIEIHADTNVKNNKSSENEDNATDKKIKKSSKSDEV